MPGGRLLILDDDPMVGQILAFVSKTVGFESRLTDQAARFFDELAAWSPTHVAIDLSMPDMPGAEVMRRMAALGSRARVIIASGAGSGELAEALQAAHALGLDTAGALSKPFSPVALRALLA
jgi:DNA-binding response OmpR family regulator